MSMSLAIFKFETSNIGVALCAGYAIEMLAIGDRRLAGHDVLGTQLVVRARLQPAHGERPRRRREVERADLRVGHELPPGKRAGERPAGERQQRLVDRQLERRRVGVEAKPAEIGASCRETRTDKERRASASARRRPVPRRRAGRPSSTSRSTRRRALRSARARARRRSATCRRRRGRAGGVRELRDVVGRELEARFVRCCETSRGRTT